jgi:hypothetical protein
MEMRGERRQAWVSKSAPVSQPRTSRASFCDESSHWRDEHGLAATNRPRVHIDSARSTLPATPRGQSRAPEVFD